MPVKRKNRFTDCVYAEFLPSDYGDSGALFLQLGKPTEINQNVKLEYDHPFRVGHIIRIVVDDVTVWTCPEWQAYQDQEEY